MQQVQMPLLKSTLLRQLNLRSRFYGERSQTIEKRIPDSLVDSGPSKENVGKKADNNGMDTSPMEEVTITDGGDVMSVRLLASPIPGKKKPY